jgi:hypothetical protein
VRERRREVKKTIKEQKRLLKRAITIFQLQQKCLSMMVAENIRMIQL